MPRRSQNAFLTKTNDELFRPHGLYCLIMSYDINSRKNITHPDDRHDLGNAIRQGMSSNTASNAMRSNDGVLGAGTFPASAELVYPSIRSKAYSKCEKN